MYKGCCSSNMSMAAIGSRVGQERIVAEYVVVEASPSQKDYTLGWTSAWLAKLGSRSDHPALRPFVQSRNVVDMELRGFDS